MISLRTLLLPAVAAALTLAAEPASATKKIQGVFLDTYVKVDDAPLPLLTGKDACLYCHQGKKKKNRNRFGEALSEHVSKKERDLDKIAAALETVAAESSDSDDASAPTWGEIIATGELPGGPLEEVREEPGG